MRGCNITYVNFGPTLSLVVRPTVGFIGPAEEDALLLHRFVGLGHVEVAIVIELELVAIGVVGHVSVCPPIVHAS
jgi:hypothetical protein